MTPSTHPRRDLERPSRATSLERPSRATSLERPSRATSLERPSRATAEVAVAPPIVGRAAVVGRRDTGIRWDDRPVLDLELLLALDGVGPYRITVRRVVPIELAARLGPGASLPVLVDPADGRRVAIRWEAVDATGPALPPMLAGVA